MPVIMSSRRRRLCALAFLLAVPGAAMAIDPPEGSGREIAVEQIVKSWESTDARLNALLGEVPPEAQDGIHRAIEANRTGRERAQAALESAGGDSAAGRERAQEALAEAAAKAERGLAEARLHVPAHVLPRLDEAAARMREGVGKGANAVATAPSSRSTADRPFAGERPDGTGRPGMTPPASGRPANTGRQTNPGRRPGG